MRTPVRATQKLKLPAHPRFKGFDAFAAREAIPRFAEVEVERRHARRRALWIAVGTALIVPALYMLAREFTEIGGSLAVLLFGVLPAIAGGLAASVTLTRFRVDLRDSLLAKTCEHLDLRYTGANATVPMYRFTEMRLLPEYENANFWGGVESVGPDLVFTAAGVKLIPKRDPEDDPFTTNWRGLLMAVTPPHRFRGRTVLMSERGKFARLLERIVKSLTGHATERIKLGLGELEAGLEILTTDPAEAREILTERAMRRLAEIMQVFGSEQTSLGFVEDSMLLAIATDANLFDTGSVQGFSRRVEIFEQLLADLALLFDLAERLRDAVGSYRPRSGA